MAQIDPLARGTTCIRSCSICSGVLRDDKPSRRASRLTCVSTTTPEASPNAVPRTTLAVLRPTPGNAVSESRSRGIVSAVVLGHLPGHRQQVS